MFLRQAGGICRAYLWPEPVPQPFFIHKLLSGFMTRKKQRHQALDFSDLVLKTKDLLMHAETRDWVRYKLDGGLDHILIDEAQDTSPEQWALITALSEEFFTGEGARGLQRTILP